MPELIESALGAPEIVYVSVSPESTSVNDEVTSRLNEASSAVLTSAIGEATVGASLVFATVRTYESLTDALEPSVPVSYTHLTLPTILLV